MTLPETAGPENRERSPWSSRRLWSLWDIMRDFPATVFVECISNIDRHYALFAKAPVGKWSAVKVISKRDRDNFDNVYRSIEEFCIDLELVSSTETLRKMRARLRDPNARYKEFFELGPEFSGRFKDEMKRRYVYALTMQEADTIENPTKGWESAVRQFPCVAYEVEEASLCLALERSTASAFHSIRLLEAGIRAISRCLGVADPTKASDRSWFKLLKAVKDAIDVKWPGSSSRMSGDGEFFDNAHAALAAMQNPWRNATMHLDQKYTPDEARHVFEIVRGFMAKLASRMDENGEPKA